MAKLTDEQKRENRVQRTYERYKAWTIGRCKNDALKAFQHLRRLECCTLYPTSCEYFLGCISCGRRIDEVGDCDAGHYISRKHSATSFCRNNVWPQCKHCNQHLSGNLADYRKRLIDKIGLDEVLLLEAIKDVPVTFTKWQFANMRECYRAMIKLEKERLGL